MVDAKTAKLNAHLAMIERMEKSIQGQIDNGNSSCAWYDLGNDEIQFLESLKDLGYQMEVKIPKSLWHNKVYIISW